MRSFRHWTPRYIQNRIAEFRYHRSHPDYPWLTRNAVEILTGYLKPTDRGLEFGSGRSTLWLAQHVGHLISVEHDQNWYEKIRSSLQEKRLTNVEYCYIPMDFPESQGSDAAYVKRLHTIESESMDFVLVDGMYRDFCAKGSIRTIRPGGVLIIDNVNWYLPCVSHSPKSRTMEQGPNGACWQEVHEMIRNWRRIWTSSGVTDTAFFFKPY